jgi:hypothetical protein
MELPRTCCTSGEDSAILIAFLYAVVLATRVVVQRRIGKASAAKRTKNETVAAAKTVHVELVQSEGGVARGLDR